MLLFLVAVIIHAVLGASMGVIVAKPMRHDRLKTFLAARQYDEACRFFPDKIPLIVRFFKENKDSSFLSTLSKPLRHQVTAAFIEQGIPLPPDFDWPSFISWLVRFRAAPVACIVNIDVASVFLSLKDFEARCGLLQLADKVNPSLARALTPLIPWDDAIDDITADLVSLVDKIDGDALNNFYKRSCFPFKFVRAVWSVSPLVKLVVDWEALSQWFLEQSTAYRRRYMDDLRQQLSMWINSIRDDRLRSLIFLESVRNCGNVDLGKGRLDWNTIYRALATDYCHNSVILSIWQHVIPRERLTACASYLAKHAHDLTQIPPGFDIDAQSIWSARFKCACHAGDVVFVRCNFEVVHENFLEDPLVHVEVFRVLLELSSIVNIRLARSNPSRPLRVLSSEAIHAYAAVEQFVVAEKVVGLEELLRRHARKVNPRNYFYLMRMISNAQVSLFMAYATKAQLEHIQKHVSVPHLPNIDSDHRILQQLNLSRPQDVARAKQMADARINAFTSVAAWFGAPEFEEVFRFFGGAAYAKIIGEYMNIDLDVMNAIDNKCKEESLFLLGIPVAYAKDSDVIAMAERVRQNLPALYAIVKKTPRLMAISLKAVSYITRTYQDRYKKPTTASFSNNAISSDEIAL